MVRSRPMGLGTDPADVDLHLPDLAEEKAQIGIAL